MGNPHYNIRYKFIITFIISKVNRRYTLLSFISKIQWKINPKYGKIALLIYETTNTFKIIKERCEEKKKQKPMQLQVAKAGM